MIASVKNLYKSYGNVKAVDGISFDVKEKEIFCLVGPNGAGKTTTLEILEGLRNSDSGEVFVCGFDMHKSSKEVKEIIGVQLQTSSLFEKLTVEEIISLFSSFYKDNIKNDLLKLIDLEEKKKSLVSDLSGGQKQRLSIALALVNDPKLIFLDEPTTGLDPQARRSVWELINDLRAKGKTIILTTHYMEEAERLSDRVAIMDGGKIIASGTPKELISSLGKESVVEFSNPNSIELEIEGVKIKKEGQSTIIYSKDLQNTLQILLSKNIRMEEMKIRNTTLEDVFLSLTGRRIKE
ncbi:MAG: ABC transporter ATP-binding protein [Thermoplasmata archaeon]